MKQLGTQVKFCWSGDHNNQTADNAFSVPWYFFDMELEPVGFIWNNILGLVGFAVNDSFLHLYAWLFTFSVLLSLHFCHLEIQV